MNALNLENINRNAPYQVEQVGESPYLFYFLTDYGVEYEIVIKSNNVLIPSGAYALDIINIWQQPSPGDPKFKLLSESFGGSDFFARQTKIMNKLLK